MSMLVFNCEGSESYRARTKRIKYRIRRNGVIDNAPDCCTICGAIAGFEPLANHSVAASSRYVYFSTPHGSRGRDCVLCKTKSSL